LGPMTGYSAATGVSPSDAHAERNDHISVPLTIGTALLCGVGLLGMAYWLLTFNWLYFASLIPLIGGAYLLFTRVTGPDHA
jgi:hypothetical protein